MRCWNIFKAKEGSKDNSFCVACPDFLCSFFSGRCHLLGFTVASEIQWNKSLREIMAWKMSSKTQIQLTTRVNREAKTPTVFRWSENVLWKCIMARLVLEPPRGKLSRGKEEDSQNLDLNLEFGDTQQILREREGSGTLFNNSSPPSILPRTIFRQTVPKLNIQWRESPKTKHYSHVIFLPRAICLTKRMFVCVLSCRW